MIAQSSIERIKDYPIYDVLQHYIPDLKKAGSSYRACSPFSGEKTPSFYVVPSKNIYKCFSSGKGGSAINFVMEKFALSYPDAIKDIAGKVGERIEFDEVSTEEQKQKVHHKEVLYKINEAAARKYAEELNKIIPITETNNEQPPTDNEIFADLIIKRQYTPDTIVQWQIGYAPGNTSDYAPAQWKFLTDLIGAKHYGEALELGLIVTKNGTTYDTFRHRIMFPIHNDMGRVVGFGGRRPKEDAYNAKYINSPGSEVYVKEKTLFGLNHAAKAIRETGYAFLMEGYTDVISFHQAGYDVAVGTCGTALTVEQCKLLRRYTQKVVMFGDGDNAGQTAMLRNIDMLVQHGFEVAIVPMPIFDDGRKVDPDDLTRMFKKADISSETQDVSKKVVKKAPAKPVKKPKPKKK
jgi:DNA primase